MSTGAATGMSSFLESELRSIRERIIQCESKVNAGHYNHSKMFNAEKELGELKAKIYLLDARIPNNSVMKLGGFTFQSQEDVFGFEEKKMPSNM